MNKIVSLLLFCTLIISCNESENINDTYVLDNDWNETVNQLGLGQVVGLDIAPNGDVVVFHRAGRKWTSPFPKENIEDSTVAIIDSESGRLLRSWGQNLFAMPHGLTVDKHYNVWVTDVGLHQVLKFNKDGQLLMTLGEERTPGADDLHFDQPTDIAISEIDGSIYISDGYGNSRVVNYNSMGEYIMDFGSSGSVEGQFNLPHGITIDSENVIYVADRENSRVQSFDSKGNLLKVWSDKSFGKIILLLFPIERGVSWPLIIRSPWELYERAPM